MSGDLLTRANRPVLTAREAEAIIECVQRHEGEHVSLFGREYWSDPDGRVYVVAWRDGDHVSGDLVSVEREVRRAEDERMVANWLSCARCGEPIEGDACDCGGPPEVRC